MTHWLSKLVTISPLFFPAYLLRFTISGIPFTALEIFSYGLFFGWVLTLRRPKKIYWKQPLPWYFVLAALFFLGASIGVVWAPDMILLPDGDFFAAARAALGVWKGWILAPLLYFWVMSQSLTNAEEVRRFLRIFVYSAVLVALFAYGMGMAGFGISYDFRLTGFYESANFLALYLLPAAMLNMVWIFERHAPSHWQHYLDTATLTILLHALLFTQSYAALLALFGSLMLYGFYMILRTPGSFKKVFIGMLVLLVTFLIMVMTQLQAPKFKQFLDAENRSSTTVRFEIYQVTWNLIQKHWLWGVGPGLYQANYQTQAPRALGRAPLEWNVPHPHNLFFAFWLNAGLLGLAALLGMLFLAHQRFTYPLLAFWAIILHGFFDTPFWKNDLAMIFWAVIVAILLLQSYGTHSAKKSAAYPRVRSSASRSRRLKAQPSIA